MIRKKYFAGALLLLGLFVSLPALYLSSAQQSADDLYESALLKKEAEGDLNGAIQLFQKILKAFPQNREVAAKAQLQIGMCYEKLGLEQAREAFRKVVEEYPEQTQAVATAREKLSVLVSAQNLIEKGEGAFRIRKVWDGAIDYTGTPSPDGRYVTYVDWDQFMNLGIHDLQTGENRLLTHTDSWDSGEECFWSVFSPDGGRIVYAWWSKDKHPQLRIVNTDGSGDHVLNEGKDLFFQLPAAWSGDGKEILALRCNPDQSRYLAFVSVVDGAVSMVKSLPLSRVTQVRAAPSPDGRYVAYSYPPATGSGNCDIYLLTADGSRQIPLVEHPADETVIGWSPDGTGVLFKSDRTGSTGIWKIPVAGGRPQGDPQLLRSDMGDISIMGLTRDGSLFYGLFSGWSDIFVASMDPDAGTILSPPVMAIRKNEGSNSAPDWSSDGELLACRSKRGFLVLSVRTGETRELTAKDVPALNFHFTRWSRDGRWVCGVGPDEKGKWGALYAVDARTGESKIITRSDEGGFLFSFEWAPDGKSFYCLRRETEYRRFVKHDMETGQETEIFRCPNSGRSWFSLSPDGKSIAFATDDGLKILDTDTGECRDLLKVKEVYTTAWTRDGKYILYSTLREGNKEINDLWRIAINKGEPQKLDLAMRMLMHVRVNPDGHRIAFTGSTKREKTEVWVIEGFLTKEK